MKQWFFTYIVEHNAHGKVKVIAENKQRAILNAARIWRVCWRELAAQCKITVIKDPEQKASATTKS